MELALVVEPFINNCQMRLSDFQCFRVNLLLVLFRTFSKIYPSCLLKYRKAILRQLRIF